MFMVYKQGLVKTAKSNFGGGNTHWEENNLGSYAFRYVSMTVYKNIFSDLMVSIEMSRSKCYYKYLPA